MGTHRRWCPYLATKASWHGSRASAYLRLMGPQTSRSSPSISRTFAVALPSSRARNTTGGAKASFCGQRYTAPGRVPHSCASHACHASRRSFSSRQTCVVICCCSRRCSSLSSFCAGSRGPSPQPRGTNGPGSYSSVTPSTRLRSACQLCSSLTDKTLRPLGTSWDPRITARRAPKVAWRRANGDRRWGARHTALARAQVDTLQ